MRAWLLGRTKYCLEVARNNYLCGCLVFILKGKIRTRDLSPLTFNILYLFHLFFNILFLSTHLSSQNNTILVLVKFKIVLIANV